MKRRLIGLVLMGIWPALVLTGQAQTQVCIPQYLDGVAGPFRWETTVFLQNQEQTQAQTQLRFLDPNGQPMEGLMLGARAGRGMQSQVGASGQFDPDPIKAGASRSYRSGGQGALQSGFCVVDSPDQVQAHARIHLFDGSGNLLSEGGIIPHPQFRNGSVFVDRTDGQGMGVSFANTSPDQSASCTLEIFAEDEETSLGTVELEMGPQAQNVQLLAQLFPEILTDDVGYIAVSCDNPVCGLALQLRGLSMIQVPILIDQSTP